MRQDELLKIIQPEGQSNSPMGVQLLKGIAIDSRAVRSGYVFIALPSVWPGRPGGAQFINKAIEAGASLIITSEPVPKDLQTNVTWVRVENPHKTLAQCAQVFY